ncbi:MAG: family 43 glycosylhydrolase [Fibrobacter sp.]|nr:family 43 glycosylhydrolase [Fibrobacter sp.]
MNAKKLKLNIIITGIIIVQKIILAENPIVQTNYTADPAPMVYNDTFYVYCGHDEDGSTVWFNMKEWRCYSSVDMANWTDHGSPLDLTAFSWANADAWAAQCIPRNGKFYMYVPVFNTTTKNRMIGVAMADNPTGPFKDALGKPMLSRYDCCYIDPTVYVDSDEQAYMYWGNPYCYYVKLNKDMTSYTGDIVQIPENAQTFSNCYGEAPWLYKRNNLYYLIWAADNPNGKENIRYSTSPNPTGPWSYKGVIMPTQGLTWNKPCTSWTNHEGIVDFKGKSYFVYHNAAAPGGGAFMRSTCIEEFTYNADGTIPQINMTLEGPKQIGHLNPYDTTQAETINWASGVKTEKCSEGGMNVCRIESGDYIRVKGVDFGTGGAKGFIARVASNTSGGKIEVRLDTTNGTLIGTCDIPGTGGWQAWTTKACDISGASDVHNVYFMFTGGSCSLFNFSWWKFIPVDPVGSKSGLRRDEELFKVKCVISKNSTGSLHVELPATISHNNISIRLFDISGKQVSTLFNGQWTVSSKTFGLDKHLKASGTYLVKVSLDGKTIFSNPVLVN